MSERVFLDTNLLLDVVLERPGFEAPLQIIQLGAEGKVELFTSYLSMANIAYILRKNYQGALIPTLKQLSLLVKVLPMDKSQLDDSMFLEGPDFEDLAQAVCAVSGGCSVLLTHNPKHFRIKQGLLSGWKSPQILTPEAFLGAMRVIQVK